MKIIKYRCDRCFKDVSVNNMYRVSLEDINYDEYEVLSMDLCDECARKLGEFLGVHIDPEELPFE